MCALNASLSNCTTRLRPVSLATYSASSAVRTRTSVVPMCECGQADTPKLAVRRIDVPSKVNVFDSTCLRTRSANRAAASMPAPGRRNMNSSPP
jgi:hypothetical protein